MDFLTRLTLLLPLAFNFSPTPPVEDPISAEHATALVRQINDDNPIKFTKYLDHLKQAKIKIEKDSLLRLIDQSNRKDRNPIFIKMLLNYLRTTRPDLELEKYFNFSAGDFPLQSDPHSPPQLDHSNWGGFTLDATQLVLDEVKIKMKDKSVTFSTTSNLEKSIITALANPKNQKTGIFFNYNIDGVEYSHTSLFYLEKNQSNCNAVFLDTVDVDLYKFFWGEIVASGILKNCKVHFASAPRQMDAYSCASYCIHDFLNIQKMEGDLFASLNEFQKAGLGGGKIRINDTVCIPHEILPPSFMTLAQASKAVLKPYINDLKPYLETMPLAKRDHRKLENSLKNHKKTYSGEHLSDEEWDSLAESFPTLAELYYNQTREINTKPKNTYTKYTSLVLKKLLNDQGPPAPASAPAPLHTR